MPLWSVFSKVSAGVCVFGARRFCFGLDPSLALLLLSGAAGPRMHEFATCSTFFCWSEALRGPEPKVDRPLSDHRCCGRGPWGDQGSIQFSGRKHRSISGRLGAGAVGRPWVDHGSTSFWGKNRSTYGRPGAAAWGRPWVDQFLGQKPADLWSTWGGSLGSINHWSTIFDASNGRPIVDSRPDFWVDH